MKAMGVRGVLPSFTLVKALDMLRASARAAPSPAQPGRTHLLAPFASHTNQTIYQET